MRQARKGRDTCLWFSYEGAFQRLDSRSSVSVENPKNTVPNHGFLRSRRPPSCWVTRHAAVRGHDRAIAMR